MKKANTPFIILVTVCSVTFTCCNNDGMVVEEGENYEITNESAKGINDPNKPFVLLDEPNHENDWRDCQRAIEIYYTQIKPEKKKDVSIWQRKGVIDFGIFMAHPNLFAHTSPAQDALKEIYTNSYSDDYARPVGIFGNRHRNANAQMELRESRTELYHEAVEVELYTSDYYYPQFKDALYVELGDSSKIKFDSGYEYLKDRYFDFIYSDWYKEHHSKKLREQEMLKKN